MANIIIPFPLRKFTDNLREVEVEAGILAECMEILITKYPGLNSILENPALLSIFVNGTLCRDVWTDVRLDHDDEISLIIPIAGG
jgi:hypothetical protein